MCRLILYVLLFIVCLRIAFYNIMVNKHDSFEYQAINVLQIIKRCQLCYKLRGSQELHSCMW